MKELSLIEKADAYDRVAKEVKDFFDGKTKMPFDVDKTLEYLFPELKESEDEKIRKEIIDIIKSQKELDSIIYDKMLTWLEKQGEQKPAWSEEDEKERKRIIEWLTSFKGAFYTDVYKCSIAWLESLKDRFSPMNRSIESDNVAKPNINVRDLV